MMNGQQIQTEFDATPRASVLIESLRDLGYSLETALADIVDNSITANAKSIRILSYPGESEIRIGILDNGDGMTWDELKIAMRPGSRSPLETRNEKDLSRFGLGLKTASFSQCRRLTVVTRKNNLTSAACWDLDIVTAKDDWTVLIPEDPSKIPWSEELGEHGTLVVWKKLDRVVTTESSEESRKQLTSRLADASSHLEMVFHRFLISEPSHPKISITLNNRSLEPFDPFNKGKSIADPPEIIRIKEHNVRIQAYTLPHHQKVSRQEWDKYAGPGGYIKNQGFYVYRERRLIIHGTWFRLARQAELSKLSRVQIDMPNALDSDWKIDVKKASAQPPPQVRERLRSLVDRICRTSKRVYQKRGRRLTQEARFPFWCRTANKNEIRYEVNEDHPMVKEFIADLPDSEQTQFLNLIRMIGAGLPYDALFADLGESPEKVSCGNLSDEELRSSLESIIKNGGILAEDPESLLKSLAVTEPYRSNLERTTNILKELLENESTCS